MEGTPGKKHGSSQTGGISPQPLGSANRRVSKLRHAKGPVNGTVRSCQYGFYLADFTAFKDGERVVCRRVQELQNELTLTSGNQFWNHVPPNLAGLP